MSNVFGKIAVGDNLVRQCFDLNNNDSSIKLLLENVMKNVRRSALDLTN